MSLFLSKRNFRDSSLLSLTTKAKDLNAMREEHDQVGELLGGGNSNILIFTPNPGKRIQFD